MQFLVADVEQPLLHGSWIDIKKEAATGWASKLIDRMGLVDLVPFLGNHLGVHASDKTNKQLDGQSSGGSSAVQGDSRGSTAVNG